MANERSKAQDEPGGATRAAVYWQGGDPRWQLHDMVPLTSTERADVCIVGGGFTGLWTAISIKRLAPGPTVCPSRPRIASGRVDDPLLSWATASSHPT